MQWDKDMALYSTPWINIIVCPGGYALHETPDNNGQRFETKIFFWSRKQACTAGTAGNGAENICLPLYSIN